MDGWWLKAQGDIRVAEPCGLTCLSNYTNAHKDYCGFTSKAVLAWRWCDGGLEAELGPELVFTHGEDITFWKAP